MKNEWSVKHLEYFNQGLSVADIAKKTGRTVDAVYKKKQRLGLSNSLDPADNAKEVPAVGIFLNDSNEIIIAVSSKRKEDVIIEFNKS